MTTDARSDRPQGVPKSLRFTRTNITALPAAPAEYVVWDEKERGLGVRVSPKGVKTYVFLGRVKGALKRVNLGRVDERQLDDAREAAHAIRGGGETDAQSARGIRVDEAFERFLKAPTKGGKEKSAGTVSGYSSDYRAHIGPALATRYVSSITRRDVEDIVDGIKAAGHPTMAGKVGRALKAFVNFCRVKGWHKGDHPCQGIALPKPETRTRYLSKTEVAAFARGIEAADISVYPAAAFRLMLLLGLRLQECLKLRWSHIDLDAGSITIPHAKGKERRVMLNEQARTLLVGLPRLSGNPYCFPGHVQGQPLTDVRKPFEKVCKAAGISDLRRHDLRRTFGSHALQSGVSPIVVRDLLGHSSLAVTEKAYAFVGNKQLSDGSSRTAAAIETMMNADLPDAVVPLRRKSS